MAWKNQSRITRVTRNRHLEATDLDISNNITLSLSDNAKLYMGRDLISVQRNQNDIYINSNGIHMPDSELVSGEIDTKILKVADNTTINESGIETNKLTIGPNVTISPEQGINAQQLEITNGNVNHTFNNDGLSLRDALGNTIILAGGGIHMPDSELVSGEIDTKILKVDDNTTINESGIETNKLTIGPNVTISPEQGINAQQLEITNGNVNHTFNNDGLSLRDASGNTLILAGGGIHMPDFSELDDNTTINGSEIDTKILKVDDNTTINESGIETNIFNYS